MSVLSEEIVFILAIIVTILFVAVAIFQMLLALGLPLGEFANGGFYKVLPKHFRILSVVNAMILLFMAIVFLQHTNVLNSLQFLPTTFLVWVTTVFLGLNTIANLFSRSKKERYVMTPLSSITFILCLIISLS